MSSRTVVATVIVGAALSAATGVAYAALTIGQTFNPQVECASDETLLQTSTPAPANGVITSWSFSANSSPPDLVRFKVARPSGSDYLIVGESSPVYPPADVLTSFPTRIPAQSGDVIGLHVGVFGDCANGYPPDTVVRVSGDPAPGSTMSGSNSDPGQVDVSANLEPDADGDGFGDETQDQCPNDPTAQTECVPPETTITKGPKARSDKPAAKFKFKSSETGSTFQCRLQGNGLDPLIKSFNACTSPRKYTNLDPGKYKFFVAAVDADGPVDPTPAKQKFKVTD
jgi:hypothetical protein